ncbi:APH domain-containing protein [Trichophyton interdigitale]|nr:APH domain-containing protein [Trichophyton interdigitale]
MKMPQSLKLLFSQSFCRISRAFLPTRSFSRVSAAQNAEVDIHNGKADWNSHDFFSFTRGRFVVAEANQLVQRCVKFNMNELARIAAQSVGARACVNVQKCPDGMYNKCFVLTMDDGQEVIAKVPNPNAGLPHQTTASEVATMDFARNVLGTPAPKVYAWNSGTTNTVGAEYIIMERMPGVQLRQVWSSMKLVEKMNLCLDIARYQSAWLSVTFSQFGGLYYTQDVQIVSRSKKLIFTLTRMVPKYRTAVLQLALLQAENGSTVEGLAWSVIVDHGGLSTTITKQ